MIKSQHVRGTRRVLRFLAYRPDDAYTVDVISRELPLDVTQVSAACSALAARGSVAQLPDGRWKATTEGLKRA
jgi:hypothetical protein